MSISVTIETVSPDTAKSWLEHNTRNRPLSRSLVSKYASALGRGEWKFTGEPITFSEDGVVTDGQHRLHAVVKSGVPIQCPIVRNVPTDAFEVTNTGKSRKSSDVMAIRGYKNYIPLAAGTRSLFAYRHGRGSAAYGELTPKQLLDMVEDNPRLVHWASVYVTHRGHPYPASYVGLWTAAEEVYGSEMVEDFVQKSMTGADLKIGHPALALRNRFLGISKAARMDPLHAAAFFIKAMVAHAKGASVGLLRFKPDNESMPTFVPVDTSKQVTQGETHDR